MRSCKANAECCGSLSDDKRAQPSTPIRDVYTLLFLGVVQLACLSNLVQSPSSQWQTGTVISVETHLYAQGERASDTVQYDVSIQVGNTIYEVLYAPSPGSTLAGYLPGTDLLVSIGKDTLRVNGKRSGIVEVPILKRRVIKDQRQFPKAN